MNAEEYVKLVARRNRNRKWIERIVVLSVLILLGYLIFGL